MDIKTDEKKLSDKCSLCGGGKIFVCRDCNQKLCHYYFSICTRPEGLKIHRRNRPSPKQIVSLVDFLNGNKNH